VRGTGVGSGEKVHTAKLSKKELDAKIDLGRKTGSLSLTATRLEAVPDAVWALVAIRKLDLTHNLLRDLPPAVSALVNLRNLDLSNNKLRRLPSLAALIALQTVW
jgi:leucine-rich repeat protein SHOC2